MRARGGLDSVAEVAQGYLEHYSKPNKRVAGYAMDCWQLETYVLPRWGKRGIREISKRDVKRLLEDLAAGTIARGGEPTTVAPRNVRAVLSKMFEWATDQEILPANPAAGVKLPSQVRRHLKKGGRDHRGGRSAHRGPGVATGPGTAGWRRRAIEVHRFPRPTWC